MSNCIVRFGGNSLYKYPVLETFAKLVAQSGNRITIVVSAIPEIQDAIEKGIELLISCAATSDQIILELKRLISERIPFQSTLKNNELIDNEIIELYNLLKGIEYTGDFSFALKDQVICYSERISTSILQSFLIDRGIESIIISPESIGLIVTEEYGNASILYAESKSLSDKLPEGINLVPGAYGITLSGKIARLGKNSTDYSAAGIARLAGANTLELWELEKEFRTSDADFVPHSSLIPRLTYEEASELSYFSEQSIHPRIVEPLIDVHIPIHVFSINNQGKILNTIINSESVVSPNVVKSIVHTEEIAILKLNGPGVGFKPGILAKVTSAFHHSGINIRSVITSQVSINIILNKNEIEKARQICLKLPLTSVSEIRIEDRVSLIAVVGHGMQQHHGVSAKLFTAVAQHKINVLLSGSGASDLVSYIIVDQSDTRKAITEIHGTFFNDIS